MTDLKSKTVKELRNWTKHVATWEEKTTCLYHAFDDLARRLEEAQQRVDELLAVLHQRFWENVKKTESCWLWTGKKDHGYGRFNTRGTRVAAHRYSYEMHKGSIPEGLVVDHLCNVRNCVNPCHLEAKTQRENLLRAGAMTPNAMNANKTHCKNGHAFSTENTAYYEGRRRCKECMRINYMKRRAEYRAKARRKE